MEQTVEYKGFSQVAIRGMDGTIVKCSTLEEIQTAFSTFGQIGIKMIGMQGEDGGITCLTRFDFVDKGAHLQVKLTQQVASVPMLEDAPDDMSTTILVNEKWAEIFLLVKEMNRKTAVWIAGIRHMEVADGQLTLSFRSQAHVSAMSDPEHAEILVGAIRVVTGLNLTVIAKHTIEGVA